MKHLMLSDFSATRENKRPNPPFEHVSLPAILFWLTLLLSAPSIYGTGKWSSCGGPGGGYANWIAIDPQNSSIVYAGLAYMTPGLHKSTNGGESWTAVSGGLYNERISALTIDRQNPLTVYAGTYNGLFKSTDRGATWSFLNSETMNVLVIDPQNSSILYAGRDTGVYKSTDGGAGWSAVNTGLGDTHIQVLAVDPQYPATLYAGTETGGVYKTTGGGATWSAVNNGITDTNIENLAIDPQNPEILYAGAVNATYKSTNGGTSWSVLNSGIGYTGNISVLTINPQNPATLYAAESGGGIVKSTDGGTSWSLATSGFLSIVIPVLAIDPQNPAILYAGSGGGGAYKSTDSGATWKAVSSGLGKGNINALAIDPQSPMTLYSGTLAGMYKSIDGCSGNWIPIGITSENIQEVVIDPQNPARVYAGSGGGGVYKSTDGGGSWSAANNGLTGTYITALAINPQNPAIVYAGAYGDGVFKSTNWGISWSAANNGLNFELVLALAINPQNPAILYAGTSGGFPGETSFGGVYKSTNSGASWSKVNSGLTDLNIIALAIDAQTPEILYAESDLRIFKSINGGASWSVSGLGPGTRNALAIDPQNPATLYTGAFGGVYKSTNGGANWIHLDSGFLDTFKALAIDPIEPRRLYAGVYYGGVWAYTEGRSSLGLTLSSGGAATANTIGSNGATQVGYAALTVKSGTDPYGTAVFSFRQNGVTVTETGVPASPPTTHARIFVDYRSDVDAVPGHVEAGKIDINTGIAVVNSGSQAANVTYTLRNTGGGLITSGAGTLAAGSHFSKFIDQFNQIAAGFALPADFPTAIQFASLEISSDQPLSIVALRMTANQRNDILYTTTPVVDLTQSLATGPIYFAQFADGGGYTSSLILLNTSDAAETGTLQILNNSGAPLVVNQVGDTADSSFSYSISSGGVFFFRTDGFPAEAGVGWVRVTPDAGTSTPVGSGVFGYNPVDVLVSESGVPAAVPTNHARVYVDLSGNHNTGLAIANIEAGSADIAVSAFEKDGVTAVGSSEGPLQLAGHGHAAKFADELIMDLPEDFTGVLDISSATPFAALTIRSLANERDDFLMTAFPIADMNSPAPSPVIFPQIADGDGYMSEFILLSPAGVADVTLSYFNEAGVPLEVGD